MNNNKYSLCFTCLLGLFLLWSCGKESSIGSEAVDGIPPGEPEVEKIENISGAATIYYKVPSDKDLLYVSAEYKINGVDFITKASPYENKLKVDGFPSKGDYQVSLYSVDRSFNESKRIEVTVSPDTTPIELIYNTLEIKRSFGGIHVAWKNDVEANIIVEVIVKDSLGDFNSAASFYSSTIDGSGTVRGYDTIPYEFGVYIRDRWDNNSETNTNEYTPLFEMELSKDEFRQITRLPGDAETSGWPITNLWDENFTGAGDAGMWHGANKNTDMGKFLTFDLGVTATLSRFKMWQRTNAPSFIYSHNNLKEYTIYGCTEITADMRTSGSLEGWTELIDVLTYKPSGSDNSVVTDEDIEYITDGDEHEIPVGSDPVRYIRILMKSNWSSGTIGQIAEMSFWGQEE